MLKRDEGYRCWLRYEPLADTTAREFYTPLLKNIFAARRDAVIESAVAELSRAASARPGSAITTTPTPLPGFARDGYAPTENAWDMIAPRKPAPA